MLMSDLCVHVFPSALTTSHDVAMLLWGATCFFLCLFFFFSFPLCHLFPTSYGIFFNSEVFFFSLLSVPFFFMCLFFILQPCSSACGYSPDSQYGF